MQTLILLCTLSALVCLPIGYGIGWVVDQADRLFDEYLDGVVRGGFVPGGYVPPAALLCGEAWQ